MTFLRNLLDTLQVILLHCKQNSNLRSSKIERLALISNIFSKDSKDTTAKFRDINNVRHSMDPSAEDAVFKKSYFNT